MDGDLDAGEGMGGEGIEAPSPSPVITRPKALRFDPTTRTHLMNSDGTTYAELHPVDALVANAMFIAANQIKSAPNVGIDWKRIKSPHHPSAKRTAEDIVKLTLAGPLSRGDITIKSIEFSVRGEFTTMLVVNYVNERLYPRVTRPIGVPI